MDRRKNAEGIRDAADQAYRATANLQVLLEAGAEAAGDPALADYARRVDRMASELDAIQTIVDEKLTRAGV